MNSNLIPDELQKMWQGLWRTGLENFPGFNSEQWEALFTVIFAASPIGIYLAQNGRFLVVNPQFEAVTGFKRAELINTATINLVVEEDRSRAREGARQMLKGTKINPYEFRIVDKWGQTHWIVESATSIQYGGRPALLGYFMDVSQRQQADTALRESRELYLDLFQNASDIIYVHDLKGQILSLNKAGEQFFGFSGQQAIGMNISRLVVPHQREYFQSLVRDVVAKDCISSFEIEIVVPTGDVMSLEVRMRVIHKNGIPTAVQGIARDVSKRKLDANQLLVSNRKLLDIIEFLPDATFVIDHEHQVIAWNRAMEEVTGIKKEAVIGTRSYAVPFYGYSHVMLVDLLDQDISQLVAENLVKKEGESLYTEVYAPRVNQGMGAYIWAKASPLMDIQGQRVGAIESIRDISERKNAEDKLRYLSLHDSLTGIYNRTYFEEEMRRLEATRSTPIGLILCDVDGLKAVNDTRGHGAGDALLASTARVLKDCFRQSDVVARVGGDEFAILITNSEESAVEQSCSRIRQSVYQYNSVHPEIPLSISVGYAFRSDANYLLSDIYREADNSMYKDKLQNCGRGRAISVHPADASNHLNNFDIHS